MFYVIDNEDISEVKLEKISPDQISVGYMTLDELKQKYSQLKISRSVIDDCEAYDSQLRTSLDVYDNYTFGIINVVRLENVMKERDKVAFIIKKNQFILIKIQDTDNSTMDVFRGAVGRFKQNATLEKVIYGIMERLLANGNKVLEIYELRVMQMEREVVAGKLNRKLNAEIYNLRNRLSVMRNYYEQLVDIGEALQENENGLFVEDELKYFKIYTDKAGRLSDNTQALSESLIHLREAIDASLNYSMNRTMKLFTVVSVIFLPLSLIVGWYGMNFAYMPELKWKFGYPAVIILCVVVTAVCLFYFRKKKWL